MDRSAQFVLEKDSVRATLLSSRRYRVRSVKADGDAELKCLKIDASSDLPKA
jgi:hypothetical protein